MHKAERSRARRVQDYGTDRSPNVRKGPDAIAKPVPEPTPAETFSSRIGPREIMSGPWFDEMSPALTDMIIALDVPRAILAGDWLKSTWDLPIIETRVTRPPVWSSTLQPIPHQDLKHSITWSVAGEPESRMERRERKRKAVREEVKKAKHYKKDETFGRF